MIYANLVAQTLENTYNKSKQSDKDFYALCLGFVRFMQKDLKGAEVAYEKVKLKNLSVKLVKIRLE